MKVYQFEAKSEDEALQIALEEFRVPKEHIEVSVLSTKGLIKKTLQCEARVTKEPADAGYEVLTKMFEKMNIEVTIEMSKRNTNEVEYRINSNENPILIGKNGKTLENIQFYVRHIVNSYSDERQIVLVDVGGYKANRKRQLEILATKTAKEVARSRVEAKLRPMNAYERRIIHTKLADWRDVSTVSEGEGHDRHLVIKPKKRK
jgi:spoIIIJ-associated protein